MAILDEARRRLMISWSWLLLPLAIASCSPGHALPRRLEARLQSLANPGGRELSADEVQEALARQLRVAPLPAKGSDSPADPAFPTRQTLEEFYAERGHRLAWCDDSGAHLPEVETLLAALRRARQHGLDPGDYEVERLERLRKATESGKSPLDDAAMRRLADFDLLMTTAYLRYASDLSTGRVHPDEIRDDWHTVRPDPDLLTGLDRALGDGGLEKLLATLPPPHPDYARLREALDRLRGIAAHGGWAAIPDGPPLQAGSRGARVVLLRQRLADAPDRKDRNTARRAASGDFFDGTLAEAVRRYQERHGLQPNGMLDAATLAELNVPAEERVRQVELNLERWRWIPRRLGDPHVLVNIPGFDLELVRGGSPVWRCRIVVGRSYTPTPVFSDEIVAIVANPPWNVPRSILLGEYVPRLRDDPEAFARHGLRVFEGTNGEEREIDPADVDWDDLAKERFPYRVRQDPGPESALGRLKLHLTNEFGIYLHDTPAREGFRERERDFSHGCIRLEKPLELAEQILGSARGVLRDALDQPKERHISVKPPVPVHILYLTVWADETGALRYGPDIYDLDGPQRAALDRTARRPGGPAAEVRRTTPAGR